MRFYRNLAFLTLVTSTLSPASSAPTPRQRMNPRVESAVDASHGVGFPRSGVRFEVRTGATKVGSEHGSDGSGVPSSTNALAPRAARTWKNAGALTGAVIAVSGIIAFIVHEVQQQAASLKGSNHTKRAWEAFEGRANAELVERALGEYDLDKRFGLLTSFIRGLGTRTGSSPTSAGVPRDVSHGQEMIRALGALDKRDVVPEDKTAALHLFSRLLNELD